VAFALQMNSEVDVASNHLASAADEELQMTSEGDVSNHAPSAVDGKLHENSEADIVSNHAASAPDGGWGWVVLAGSFVSFFIADGWSYSFGVLFPSIVEYFSESRGTTALVGTLLYAIPMIISPLACALVTTYGCRPVAVGGGILTGVSLAVACLARSISDLCIIVGILSAIGLALVYISSLFIVTIYFDRRRGLATGLAVTGSGVGALVFPPLIEWLNETYAWRGCLLITGGICLHIVAAGMLYRPLSIPGPIKNASNAVRNVSCIRQLTAECRHVLVSLCSRKVLTSGPFVIFCFANFILFLWVSIPYVYIVDLALSIGGMTETTAALLLSLAGGGRIIGQIVFGIIGDIKEVSSIGLFGFGVTVAGLGTMLVPIIATIFSALAVYMSIFGVAVSVSYVLPVICLVKMVGFDRSVKAFGILQMTQGVATLLGTPIAG